MKTFIVLTILTFGLSTMVLASNLYTDTNTGKLQLVYAIAGNDFNESFEDGGIEYSVLVKITDHWQTGRSKYGLDNRECHEKYNTKLIRRVYFIDRRGEKSYLDKFKKIITEFNDEFHGKSVRKLNANCQKGSIVNAMQAKQANLISMAQGYMSTLPLNDIPQVLNQIMIEDQSVLRIKLDTPGSPESVFFYP